MQKLMRAVSLLCKFTFAFLATIQLTASLRLIKVFPVHRKSSFLTPIRKESCTKCNLVENSVVSLAAGALAGSIGVGVAYPLDALKTKAQTYASSKDAPSGKCVLLCTLSPFLR